MLFISGCRSHKEIQVDLLRKLGVENAEKFAVLSPCKQIEIYAFLGSEYTDIDHMTVLVPKWMKDEIDKQPSDEVADCIVDETNKLLSQWDTSYSENDKISYSVHALLYKANDIDINKHPQLEELFNRVVCYDKVFYDGQLISIYYATKYGYSDFPSDDIMVSVLCQ